MRPMDQSTLSVPTAPRVSRSRRAALETLAGYLFILPAIIGFCVFVAYPMVSAAYYALTDWNGIGEPTFIGLENFRFLLFQDQSFRDSLYVTMIYVILNVPASLALGLLLAVLLNRRMRGIGIFRTIFYLPTVLPVVATVTLWKFIFNPQFGLANALLQRLGLPTSLWLASETLAMPSLVLINLWGIGATMVIFLAGLQAVPQEMYEAAALDGAGRWDLFARITVPLISPILFLQLVLQTIASLQTFVQPKILTQGGPNNATMLLMLKIYNNGFGELGRNPAIGYATAQVWILFAIILVVTLFTFRFSNMWVFSDNTVD